MKKEYLRKIFNEKTLLLIKPDAIRRGLVGAIIERLERPGLKMVACKLVMPSRAQLNGHFPKSEEWIRGMGEKTLEIYKEYGIAATDVLGTSDAFEIGKKIKEWNYCYLLLGPVMISVLQGIHAVDTVRKFIGNTLPFKAEPGTIRGDFSINAPDLANLVGSACKNLVHASATIEEAESEIKNWFEETDILNWERTSDHLHFLQGESSEVSVSMFTEMDAGHESTELKFERLKATGKLREAGEYAFALAISSHQAGDINRSVRFRNEAIALFELSPAKSINDLSPFNAVIDNVVIPNLITDDIVRHHLQQTLS